MLPEVPPPEGEQRAGGGKGLVVAGWKGRHEGHLLLDGLAVIQDLAGKGQGGIAVPLMKMTKVLGEGNKQFSRIKSL